MKALVEKDILMKNKKKRWGRLHIVFMHIYQGNLRFFKGSARRSNGMKKTQEKAQRGEISQTLEEQEKRKHRSALRALKNT